MPAAVPIVMAVTAAMATGASLYTANAARQEAKGVANAASDAAKKQVADAEEQMKKDSTAKSGAASATQSAAIAALRSSMAANSGMGGTILTSPLGATPAPTATKALLGA